MSAEIKVHCPTCEQKFAVPMEMKGMSIHCPECGTDFTAEIRVPVPHHPPPMPVNRRPPPPLTAPTAERSGMATALMILGITLGVAALWIVTLGVVKARMPKPSEDDRKLGICQEAVDQMIRITAKDPQSVEIVDWTRWRMTNESGATVGYEIECTWRSKNSFGAVVPATMRFKFDSGCRIIPQTD